MSLEAYVNLRFYAAMQSIARDMLTQDRKMGQKLGDRLKGGGEDGNYV